MACMAVCFTQTVFAGSGNEAVKSVNHKGYNTVAPENTLPAFELSAEKGYKYVETDISFTRDGVPVLLHNSNINVMARNPDGSELAQEDIEIGTLTYEEVLQYDFTKGMTGYKGTKIARLDDFLDLCRTKSLHPYLELKNNGDYSMDQIRGLVKLVRQKGMEGKVSWISFEARYLKWVREENPKARLGFLNIVSDEETMKESVKVAKDLKTSENEVFLDLANKTPYVTYDYSLCEKEGIPVEIWVNDGLNEFMGITERDVLETLDPYVSGATVDKYIYAKPVTELSPGAFTYNGEVQKPAITVSVNGEKLKEGDCELTWPEGCRDAGTYQVTARLRKGILAGAGTAEFIIRKSDNMLSVKSRTAKISYRKLKKKSRTLVVSKVIRFKNKGVGQLTYTAVNNSRKISINKKTGTVTLKKGIKKGTYKLKVKVRADGNNNYNAVAKTVTAKTIVK